MEFKPDYCSKLCRIVVYIYSMGPFHSRYPLLNFLSISLQRKSPPFPLLLLLYPAHAMLSTQYWNLDLTLFSSDSYLVLFVKMGFPVYWFKTLVLLQEGLFLGEGICGESSYACS